MMNRHDISDLISMSRTYGSDTRFVLLGGGNTSKKIGDVMYVKASGCALSDIDSDGFVAMSLPKLKAIWEKCYSEEAQKREEEILLDMMDARCEGETSRPSVEALLHSIIPYTYVVHLHPALVNGLTCSQSGRESMKKLFPEAMWIPSAQPGYMLAKAVKRAQQDYVSRIKTYPNIIFLQNHGVFVGGDSLEDIDRSYDHIIKRLTRTIARKPNFAELKVDNHRISIIKQAMQSMYGDAQEFPVAFNRELANRLTDEQSFFSLSSAYTPDHILYSGCKPLWIEEVVFEGSSTIEDIKESIRNYEISVGIKPKVLAVQQTAVIAIDESAMALFIDTIKIAVFTESFGGPRFMDNDQIQFILNWEAEKYRVKVKRNRAP